MKIINFKRLKPLKINSKNEEILVQIKAYLQSKI